MNNYKKYIDGQSILFVKDEILNEFTISQKCFFNERSKLIYVYVTSNNNNLKLLNNIIRL